MSTAVSYSENARAVRRLNDTICIENGYIVLLIQGLAPHLHRLYSSGK